MGKPGPKAINIFQKLKLGNNSVKSMPKYDASPVKKALKGDQDKLPLELQAEIKAAPGKKYKTHAKKLKSPSIAKKYKSHAKKFKSDAQRKAAYASGYKGK
jgi:hypothetical protein